MRKNKIISVSALIAILSCVLGISSFAEVDALDNAVKPLGERTVEALGNLVLGMLVIFAVMAILCVILSFTGKFFSSKEKKTDAQIDLCNELGITLSESDLFSPKTLHARTAAAL